MAEELSNAELMKMGLLEKRMSISIEKVMLRVPNGGNNRRAQLFQKFQTDNAGKDDIFGWNGLWRMPQLQMESVAMEM